jgi:hypothetical protein
MERQRYLRRERMEVRPENSIERSVSATAQITLWYDTHVVQELGFLVGYFLENSHDQLEFVFSH